MVIIPEMRIALLTAAEARQAYPADVLPTPALDVVAPINLLDCVPARWAVPHVPFPLAPFHQRLVGRVLELPVTLAGYEWVVLQMAPSAGLGRASCTNKRLDSPLRVLVSNSVDGWTVG